MELLLDIEFRLCSACRGAASLQLISMSLILGLATWNTYFILGLTIEEPCYHSICLIFSVLLQPALEERFGMNSSQYM